MKIYTRTGDGGETGLFGGGRVPKSHPRVEAYGNVDELNSVIGLAVCDVGDDTSAARLSLIQRDLFAIGSSLASPPVEEGRNQPEVPDLPIERIAAMEAWMDEADGELPPLQRFILPGGIRGAATLHVARSVCRRAERSVVELAETESVEGGIIQYLNRLSDLLFVMARVENRIAGKADVEWEK